MLMLYRGSIKALVKALIVTNAHTQVPYAYAGASLARFLIHLLAALKKSNRALTAAFIEALIEANSYTQVLLILDFFIFFFKASGLDRG